MKKRMRVVTLSDPMLNIGRVANRVKEGGHDVPRQKIKERYLRCMELLFQALAIADSAYLFDNSNHQPVMIAYKENGTLETVTDTVPVWYTRFVTDKLKMLE